MKHASSLPLAIAICLSLAPFARGQIAGGTVDPSTIQPFTSGNGATNAGGPSGPGVSAVAHVNHPETQELIYGFQINYNGPLPAPSATTIDISGMIGGFALPGDNAQAEVEFGALANVGGSAGFAGSPLVTANGVANSTVTTFSQSFGQSYNVFVGQSYAVELYTSADIIAGTAGAFVHPQVTLDLNVPDPSDYSIVLSPGITEGSLIPGAAPVPEPSTYVSAVILLLPLARLALRRFKAQAVSSLG